MISITSTRKQWVLLAAAAIACSAGTHQVDCHTPTRQFASIKSLKKDLSKEQRQRRSPAWLLVRGGDEVTEDASQVFIEEESMLEKNISAAAMPAFEGTEESTPEPMTSTLQQALAQMVQPPPTAPVANKLLSSLQERTVTAVLMMAGLGVWTYFMREDGLLLLVFALQMGMYAETTSVMQGSADNGISKFNKWWWFATFTIMVNGSRVFPWATPTLSAMAYGMTALGIVGNILGFNYLGANDEAFQQYIQEAAVSHLAMLLVVLPSSFWISILEEYGMGWVLYSMALVVINDTMAYLFGATLGKHALLPEISPKKTVEGFAGAAVSTVLASILFLPTKKDALVLSLVSSLLGPFGGFLASVMKRAYGEKDFGDMMPVSQYYHGRKRALSD
jgi:CDP-diglyceride synthetase